MSSVGAAHRRHFIILQGLATPFFFHLAQHLRAAGHESTKIQICGADLVFWPGRAVLFRERADQWPAFLEAQIEKVGATDIILFGDCRPLHRIAVAQARQRGILVHVFEEGYVRPGYITLEEGGTNGYSRFPRDPDFIKQRARDLPCPVLKTHVASSFFTRALWDVLAQTVGCALAPLFPHYRWHGTDHPFMEYAGFVRRFARSPFRNAASKRTVGRLITARTPFFLMPLQLNSDFQIRVHSRYSTVLEAIEEVVASFAGHAPTSHTLVFKLHPLDPELVSYRDHVERLSARYGVGTRVAFICTGDLPSLLGASDGVVLVNSTTALVALQLGCRVKALGTAVYNLPGLSFQDHLDDFWTIGSNPEPAVVQAFLKLLVAKTQIAGDFFAGNASEIAARNASREVLLAARATERIN